MVKTSKMIEFMGVTMEIRETPGGGYCHEGIEILVDGVDIFAILDTQSTGRNILETMFQLAERSDKDGNGED